MLNDNLPFAPSKGPPRSQLGLDYQRLVYEEDGLKEKLTSSYKCRVVKEILA